MGPFHVFSLVGGLVSGISGEGPIYADNVLLPMGLQPPSAPSDLSPTPPLGIFILSPMFNWESIYLLICQASVRKHFLASAISEFGVCIWDGSPNRAVAG